MNITKYWGGNWLCTGARTSFDGTYWNAELSYTRSGDTSAYNTSLPPSACMISGMYGAAYRWDPDLYGKGVIATQAIPPDYYPFFNGDD